MLLTNKGVIFDNYVGASPDSEYSTFREESGACLTIKTTTLVRMYELVKFDLERSGCWDRMLSKIEEEAKVRSSIGDSK